LVERDQIGSGASWGNCGYVCPSHVHPLCGPGAVLNGFRTMAKRGGALSIPPRYDPALWRWLIDFTRSCNESNFHHASVARHALLQSSHDLYQQLAVDHASQMDWQPRGLLMVYQSVRDFEAYQEKADQLGNEFGLRIERYDGDGLCELEPKLRRGLAGGWYFPDDAQLSPQGLITVLRGELERAGVEIREHTNIESVEVRDHCVENLKTTGDETLSGDAFVFTMGAEAGRFGKALGVRIPVVPGKGYSVTIQTDDDVPRIPMIFEEDHVAVTSFRGAFRIGSTMQLTGFDRSVPDKRIELLKRAARAHLTCPVPQGEEHRWSGWRPMMPDGLPCIGPAPSCDNAFVAAGNGMIGMASGPATGKLIAEQVTGNETHVDPFPFRLERFGKRTGSSSSTDELASAQQH
jgi:D-amino-acid dehydrogenase